MTTVLASIAANVTVTVSGQVGRTARRGPGDRSGAVAALRSAVVAAGASTGAASSRERGRLTGIGNAAATDPPGRWVNSFWTGATGRSCCNAATAPGGTC